MKTEPPWTNEFNLFMFPVRSRQAREVMSMLKTTQHTEGLGWDLNLSLGAQPKMYWEGEGGKRRRKRRREKRTRTKNKKEKKNKEGKKGEEKEKRRRSRRSGRKRRKEEKGKERGGEVKQM